MSKSLILVLGFAAVLASGLHIQMNLQGLPAYANIQADNGYLLARCQNCGPSLLPDSAAIYPEDPSAPTAIWKIEQIRGYVAFKSSNGNYLTACSGCWVGNKKTAAFLENTNPNVNLEALWKLIDLGDGKWAIKQAHFN